MLPYLVQLMQPKKVVGIIYMPGASGGILTRILQSHKESYWNKDWINHDDPDVTSPIQFPNNPITFKIDYRDEIFPSSYYLYATHGMYHSSYRKVGSYIKDFSTTDKKIFFYDANQDYRKLNIHKSPVKHYLYCKATSSYIVERIIKVFQENTTFGRNYNHLDAEFTNICKYIVDIEKLLNTDYYVFEEEYNKLISYYNLTSRISCVRAFILAWIERQSLDSSRHIKY
jgi:hypothetical protein